ncbi:MAG: formylmethanofuran dehydrogenase subunit C [Methanopyri archaeon]|jgi:formylmethanofuran dehydrogenase subunit C|nr:formylmethanofuran dehydrogenase subunit C [Methanopyri archaeon]
MVVLRPTVAFTIPVEAECISPDIFAAQPAKELGKLEVLWGNKRKPLSELFEIDPSGEQDEIVIEGDVSAVKHIGARMTTGLITIHGNAGMHLGTEMDGGRIVVHGDVGDWLGAEMKDGLIHVKGNTGNLAGAGYRGSKTGMAGGSIIIEGNAGDEVGELMCGGTIAVAGGLGTFAGTLMTGGTIVCLGVLGGRAGAAMDGGTIIALTPPRLLPTFIPQGTDRPSHVGELLQQLKGNGFPLTEEHIGALFDRYEGDVSGKGKGEVFVRTG